MTEIDGVLLNNDYKVRKLTQSLSEKDREIQALKSQLEDTKRKAEADLQKKEKVIEKLIRSNNQYRGFKKTKKPRESALVETKAESPGDAQESEETR